MCVKGHIAAAFDSSEPLHLLGLNGRVGAIPTYRVYRLYDRDCYGLFPLKTIYKVFHHFHFQFATYWTSVNMNV